MTHQEAQVIRERAKREALDDIKGNWVPDGLSIFDARKVAAAAQAQAGECDEWADAYALELANH